MFEILDREPRLTSPPGAPALPAGGGRVELHGVNFGYDGGEPILRDVDLTVNPVAPSPSSAPPDRGRRPW